MLVFTRNEKRKTLEVLRESRRKSYKEAEKVVKKLNDKPE
jgi:hypothetical protein